MTVVSQCKGHVGDNCCKRLVGALAAAVLYFAGVFACQAQLAYDNTGLNTAQQTSPPAPKPPEGTKPPATQQAPLGSEESAGAQQPPTGTQPAPPPEPQDARLDIYGFAMLDSGYNFGTNDPNRWLGRQRQFQPQIWEGRSSPSGGIPQGH